MQRDYESTKKIGVLSVWEAGSSMRRKRLLHLKKQREKYAMEYLVPFFHFPDWNIYALWNLLEDIEEEMPLSLQGEKDSRMIELQERFCMRLQEARISFVYESLKLACNSSPLIQKEFQALYESIQRKKSSFSREKNECELRVLAFYLYKIKEIKQNFTVGDFLDKAPEFFWEIYQQIHSIESQKLAPQHLDIFYALTQSLLENRIQEFQKIEPDCKILQNPQGNFEKAWKEVEKNYKEKILYRQVLLGDLQDMETKAQDLRQMQKTPEEDYQENLRDWVTETIQKQQNNRFFLTFCEDKEIQLLYREYDFLCVSLIHLCYLFSIENSIENEISLFLQKVHTLQILIAKLKYW